MTTLSKRHNVLVLGASGMLGSAVIRYFVDRKVHTVIGSLRSPAAVQLFPAQLRSNLVAGVDVTNWDSVVPLFATVRPTAVINCVVLIKQLADANDPLAAIPINSLLPHRLAQLCAAAGARLVHLSTDCVFSGSKGMYREEDLSDAKDLYGRSKFLGEVDYPNAITLRTSMIGHELNSANGLVGWFLSQSGEVHGYRKAVFSGFPTVELARIIHDFVLPNDQLRGVIHVSAEPIDKFSLLQEIARRYEKSIAIKPDDAVVIDRSLDSSRFRAATGYLPPSWPELVAQMHRFG